MANPHLDLFTLDTYQPEGRADARECAFPPQRVKAWAKHLATGQDDTRFRSIRVLCQLYDFASSVNRTSAFMELISDVAIVAFPSRLWTSAQLSRRQESGLAAPVSVQTAGGFIATTNGGGDVLTLAGPYIATQQPITLPNTPAITVVEVSRYFARLVPPGLAFLEDWDENMTIPLVMDIDPINHTLSLTLPSYDEATALCRRYNVYASNLQRECRLSLVLDVAAHAAPRGSLSHRYLCGPECPGGGPGVVFVDECQGYARDEACLNPETAHLCAFGAGGQCSSCPSHALCPGGFRAWPVPGYWTPDGSSGVVYPCTAPASLRCRGWSEEQHRSACGEGYDPSAPLCSSCATGFYAVDGQCLPCPDSQRPGVTSVWKVMAVILGGAVLVYVLLTLTTTIGFRTTGLPVSNLLGSRISGDFMLWMALTTQVFLQLTRLPTPGMPGFLRTVFSYIQLLETDVSHLVPYQCSSGSPFTYTLVVGGVSMAATGITIALGVYHAREFARTKVVLRRKQLKPPPGSDSSHSDNIAAAATRCRPTRWLHYLALMAAVLTYSVSVNKALDALHCTEVDTARLYESEGQVAVEYETKMIWSPDSRYECFVGDHFLAFCFAIAVLAITGAGLPISVSYFACKRVRVLRSRRSTRRERVVRAASSSTASRHRSSCWRLEEAVHDEIRNERHSAPVFGFGQPWLRSLTLFHMLAIAVLAKAIPLSTAPLARAVVLCSLLFGAALFLGLPWTPTDHRWGKWKKAPRALVLGVSGVLVVLQTQLALDVKEGARGGEEGAIELSRSTVLLTYAVLGLTALLPLTLFASFFIWFFRLVPCSMFWRPCCRCCRCCSSRKVSKDAAASLLNYLSSHSTEGSVRQLVSNFSRNSVVEALVQENPRERVEELKKGRAYEMAHPITPPLAPRSKPDVVVDNPLRHSTLLQGVKAQGEGGLELVPLSLDPSAAFPPHHDDTTVDVAAAEDLEEEKGDDALQGDVQYYDPYYEHGNYVMGEDGYWYYYDDASQQWFVCDDSSEYAVMDDAEAAEAATEADASFLKVKRRHRISLQSMDAAALRKKLLRNRENRMGSLVSRQLSAYTSALASQYSKTGVKRSLASKRHSKEQQNAGAE